MVRMLLEVVCDVHTAQEEQRHPDFLPQEGSIHLFLLPVRAKSFDPAVAIDRLRSGEQHWLPDDFFIDLYRQYIDDSVRFRAEYCGSSPMRPVHPNLPNDRHRQSNTPSQFFSSSTLRIKALLPFYEKGLEAIPVILPSQSSLLHYEHSILCRLRGRFFDITF